MLGSTPDPLPIFLAGRPFFAPGEIPGPVVDPGQDDGKQEERGDNRAQGDYATQRHGNLPFPIDAFEGFVPSFGPRRFDVNQKRPISGIVRYRAK